MSNLLIKEFPEETLRRVKADAALAGKTLREWVIQVLREYEYVAEEPPVAQPTEAVERPTG
jgi:hypothetical protein